METVCARRILADNEKKKEALIKREKKAALSYSPETDAYICNNCGKVCLSRIGLISLKTKPKPVTYMGAFIAF